MTLALLIFNASLTWFMTGLIWFVQIVHYPLFDAVPEASFVPFANRHCQLTGSVVMLPMIGELLSSFMLIFAWQESGKVLVWLGFSLVAAIWLCTLLFSIPCHNEFCTTGFSKTTHDYLVTMNWLRTALWTARAFLLAWLIFQFKMR